MQKFTFREASYAIKAIKKRHDRDLENQSALHGGEWKAEDDEEEEEEIDQQPLDSATIEAYRAKYKKDLEARGNDVRINNKN